MPQLRGNEPTLGLNTLRNFRYKIISVTFQNLNSGGNLQKLVRYLC
jgi:hypothetical protein